jgi:hypothetical protein
MSLQTRALLIGLTGPALQAIGLVWELVHLFTDHIHGSLTPRHIVFEPSTLVILVGFLVSVVAIPVAIEVARAAPEDVLIPSHLDEPSAASDSSRPVWGA